MIDEKLYKEKKKFGKGFIYQLNNGVWICDVTMEKFQNFLKTEKEKEEPKEEQP